MILKFRQQSCREDVCTYKHKCEDNYGKFVWKFILL